MKDTWTIRILAVLFILVGVPALLWLWWAATIVFDPYNQAKTVFFQYSLGRERLIELPGGLYVGISDGDGQVVAECSDRTVTEGPYISNNMGVFERISEDCHLRR